MPNTVRFHRVLRATPERVYRAFLDADALVKWLPPNGFTGKVHHLDARVGGGYRMSFTNFTTGNGHAFGGTYLELVPRERLHGQVRGAEPARRDADDRDVEKGVRRDRAAGGAGRDSGCHSPRGVLSRLAGIARPPGEARRGGGSGVAGRGGKSGQSRRRETILLHGRDTPMARSSTADIIGLVAIVIGGLLVLGAFMFLSVALLTNDLPRVLLIPPVVQMVLGLLASAAGFLLRRGHTLAKFVLAFVAIGVVANLVFLVFMAMATMR